MTKFLWTLLFATMLSTHCASAAPPDALLDKSVVISWLEVREQRPVGEPSWLQIKGSEDMKIYVSSAGRIFSEHVYATPRGSGSTGVQIAGEGSARQFEFDGNAMTALMPYGKEGASRIVVTFDAAFAGCTADVVRAKEEPGTTIKVFSKIINRMIEIKSAKISDVTCRVQTGSVIKN